MTKEKLATMICPHCRIGINVEFKYYPIIAQKWNKENSDYGSGFELKSGLCPACGELIVILTEADIYDSVNHGVSMHQRNQEIIIFPKYKFHKELPSEVQGAYRKDFFEAYQVLDISPKASAAISRRLLQHLLREEFKITRNNLVQEIEEFISRNDIPPYLIDSVDAIRNVGNFAAHPMKSINTGEIIEVEYGEAEWLLEVVEALFDYALVQPKRIEDRRKRLNEKLRELGKPEMK